MIGSARKEQGREHQRVDRPCALREGDVLQVMPEDVVSAEKAAISNERIEFLCGIHMERSAVFRDSAVIRDRVVFRIDLQINEHDRTI